MSIDADGLRASIAETWPKLTRGLAHLAEAARDPKLPSDARPRVYIARSESLERVIEDVRAAAGSGVLDEVEIRRLPTEAAELGTKGAPHGLLYLPGDYVVPGGRFNELYGWDSLFIQRGLYLSGHTELGSSMLAQMSYEIERYGFVLNANRSYYLTRSQPPLFSQMVVAAERADPSAERLRRLLPMLERNLSLWIGGPHLDASTGLSRYRDYGHGPADEVLADEIDAEGRDHYDRIALRLLEDRAQGADVDRFLTADGRLTHLAFLGDRSMRESGFDTSDRFGPLSLDIPRYAPVCLNTFLWMYERDLAEMWTAVGMAERGQAWRAHADARGEVLRRLAFDPREGMFFDVWLGDDAPRTPYPFLTTFLPLFAGLASPEEAEAVRAQLHRFERRGGLVCSPHVTGCQWDAPFAWAPLHLFAVGGLHRYGFVEDARRVAGRLIETIHSDWKNTGVFKEKYDAEAGSGDVESGLRYGYATNEIGFGWTNGVVLELLRYLETGFIELPGEPIRPA